MEESQASRYVAAGLLGALLGAVAVAMATRALPMVMSRAMAGMMKQMMEGGGSERMKACMERCGCGTEATEP